MTALTGHFDPLGLPYPRLEAAVRAHGGAREHAVRWFRTMHRHGQPDPGEAHELGRALTARLRDHARPAQPTLQHTATDPDGTVKLRLGLQDGNAVEAVLIPDKQRLTLCLSSQAGCALGCTFCATATMGLRRNLSAGEIVGQVQVARRVAGEALGQPITNLVFMGMGEPLHNWPVVRDAIAILRDPNGYSLSKRRITVSTSGVLPRMAQVVTEARVALALSLHATRDEERDTLIPLNRTYPIAPLVVELRRIATEHGGIIMVQYLLLDGVNDSPDHARELWALLRDFPCHLNLLQYNTVPGLPYGRPSDATVARFKQDLMHQGARVYHRASRGLTIGGACGQLALEADATAP